MKLISSAFALLAIFTALSVRAEENTPLKVRTQFGRLYIVDGFDNNDNVQIVGEGLFPNSCYRNAETLFKVDHKEKTILLAPLAYKYPGLCLQVIMPFDRVIEVGLLKEGQYEVLQEGDSRVLGEVKVLATTSKEPDEQMYAPISQAFVQASQASNKVFLTGDFPLSCMKLKEVKAKVQADVLVVLPVAEIDSSKPCNKGRYHFDAMTDIGPMKTGRYLLHVRSMNGKSVNNLFDVR